MEFRPLAQICRTAATASSKPSSPLLNLNQHSPFSTARVLLQEAAARAPQSSSSSSSQSSLPPRPRVLGLSSKLNQTPAPRPPPLRTEPLFGSSGTGSLLSPRKNIFSRTAGKQDNQVNISALINRDAKQSLGKESGTLSILDSDIFKQTSGLQAQEVRLRPTTGRTIPVKSNDPARAFKLLNRLCFLNRLSATARDQRFHERPALKRKRKLRERWRSRFKDGFQAAIDRTMELRRQGW
ncbi:hypothetical protein QBC40DRAFT_280941 [Triangularia verruculosa]|uniref:Ribosomal protein S21 n=1 Tax=Triangularia verruculosa TaxID=2587418 RepID=A0AAN6XG66_9PEZI|nr:hypothetical protein QBC40DRAFT_280941 [Triangularia verruculosa]